MRNKELDGLRGLAALAVLIGHCNYAGAAPLGFTIWDFHALAPFQIAERLWHTIFNADAAVLIFFVLSGHVLTVSLRGATANDLGTYVVRRAFRLFPVSIAAALPLLVYYRPPLHVALGTAFLFDHSVNGTIWSLQIELVGCMMIFALAVINRPRVSIAVGLLLMLWYTRWKGWYVPFLPAFVAGSLISRTPKWVFDRTSFWFGVATLVLIDLFVGKDGAATRWAEAAAAFFVIGYIASNRVPLLASKPLQFLGDVSYPLYLLGIPVLLLGEWALDSVTGHNAIRDAIKLAAFSVPVCIAGAYVLHRCVETPWLNAGKALLQRLQPDTQALAGK